MCAKIIQINTKLFFQLPEYYYFCHFFTVLVKALVLYFHCVHTCLFLLTRLQKQTVWNALYKCQANTSGVSHQPIFHSPKPNWLTPVTPTNYITGENIYFQLAESVPVWSKSWCTSAPIMPHLTLSNQISCLINAAEGLIIVMISSPEAAGLSPRKGKPKGRLKAPTFLLSVPLSLPDTCSASLLTLRFTRQMN